MIRIITDTTAGLPQAIVQRYSVTVIPQIVVFGEDSFYEGVDLDNSSFMAKLMNSKIIPKTAAPPPELFSRQFALLSEERDKILCIHPSSDISGTVRSATVAAMDYPNLDIHVIDSRVVGSPLATMVELACQWADAGESIDAIEARIKELIPRCRIYFLVPNLDYLIRGGRIGGASALLGTVLQIKPILTLRDGHVDQYEKERTYKRAVARLKEIVYEQYPQNREGYLSVMHAGVPDSGAELAQELRTHLKLEHIPILDVPPAIVTHGGPGILAAAFFS